MASKKRSWGYSNLDNSDSKRDRARHSRHGKGQSGQVAQAATQATQTTQTTQAGPEAAVRDIPGFYYDLEKKKYFKITANHQLGSQHPFSQQSIKEKTTPKPTLEPIRRRFGQRFPSTTSHYGRLDWFLQDCQLGLAGSPRRQLCEMHALAVKFWKRSRHMEPILPEASFEYTHMTVNHANRVLLLGTSYGQLWRCPVSERKSDQGPCTRLESRETSRVTSIHETPDKFLITTHLGNVASGVLLVRKETMPTEDNVVLTYSPRKSTIWTSALAGNKLVVGEDGGITILLDWKSGRHCIRSLKTGSDVFSIAIDPPEKGNAVYAGCRNGTVKIFDLNQPQTMKVAAGSKLSRSNPAFQGIGHQGSSVSCIKRVSDHYLVTSAMSGEISMWDIRFTGALAKPVLNIRGPLQGRLKETPFDINCEETLLAVGGIGGIDQQLSLWSLSTGHRVRDLDVGGSASCLGFSRDRQGLWVVVGDQVQFWGL
ncbi:WD40-repeat-containing domain protein [Gamsiella multidivaricata]|uniref:WD40-repeat-containing domain protein n=1 Tax=Gamsiella multidivaricata TaxID=101098 RepID=UPI00221F137E|nr:WD40-repeat-containing domain protein [Gamsiella multidivaricata]KAI7831241.1 WD40-repeat-containing domain protein [Gamsiella multidivaricata]